SDRDRRSWLFSFGLVGLASSAAGAPPRSGRRPRRAGRFACLLGDASLGLGEQARHLTDLLGLRNLLAELSVSLLRLRALTDVGLDSLGDLALGLGGLRHDSSPSCLAWHRQRPGCHPGTDAGPARVSPSVELELLRNCYEARP